MGWILIGIWTVGIFLLLSIKRPNTDTQIIAVFLWPVGIAIILSDWIHKKYWGWRAAKSMKSRPK